MSKFGFDYFGKKKKKKAKVDNDEEYTPYGSDDNDSDYYDEYGYGSYYSSGRGKSSGGYSRWNWGTYGYGNVEEDDDNDLFIKSHTGYFTPTSDDIGWKLDRGENTKNNRDLIKEFSRFFYHKMIDEKEYFAEKYSDPTKLNEKEMSALAQKTEYYKALWDKFIPGYTPMEQAMSLYRELQRQKQEEKNKRRQQGKPDKPEQGKEGELADGDIEDLIHGLEFHEEIYNDPILNELLEMQDLAKTNKIEILNMISMIENLGSQFKIEKDVTEKLAHNSRLVSKKIMRDYSQLHQVDMYQRLLPHYRSKLLTKNLVVTVPIEKTEHKQKIIIMVDFSGSMNMHDKQKWVLAIMIDRLKYAIKEEAEIFFSFFVHRVEDLHFTHIYNRETALEFWSKFSTRPNGGDTYIGLMIDHVNNEINKHKRLHNLKVDLSEEKPEVLIINDGQDTIKTKAFSYKTNAVTLVDAENQELKELCIKNDGKYVYIGHHGVKTYDRGQKT